MYTKNLIFHQGEVKIFENLLGPSWTPKTAILFQSSLILTTSSLSDENPEGKLKLNKMRIGICSQENQWQIDLIQDKKVNCFRVDTLESAQQWHKMLTLASCWTSYKQYCEMQKLQPWVHLLQWAIKGEDKIKINLQNFNNLAVCEFLRGNKYIRHLAIEDLKNEFIILSRILMCFSRSQLISLNLSHSGLNNKSLKKLKRPLSSNNYLKSLDLSFNLFTYESIRIILKIFMKMPYLESFNFGGNLISDQGFLLFFPEILIQVPIKSFYLSKCAFTDSIIKLLCYILKLRENTLELLDLSQNDLSLEGIKSILKFQNKIRNIRKVELLLTPFVVDENVVKYIDNKIYTLNRVLTTKNLPLRRRGTLEDINKRITNLGDSPFVEDLAELINDIGKLGMPLPRTKQEKVEKIVNDYLIIAVSHPNYYCLEFLVPALKKIGIRHYKAEEQFKVLTNEVEHILNTLESVLTFQLYTEENIPELNSLLDSIVRRCDEICVRGEIVQLAKILKAKRDKLVNLIGNRE